MTIKYSPSDKNRDAINKLIPGTPSAPQPDRWAEPQQAQPQRSNPPPILPLAPLQELQSGRWEVNASLPASWQPKENRPSYWSDPRRIGRYYHAIKALPENAFIPEWIDAPGIEAAYNYLKETRSGSWETWENVTDDDPLNTIIKSMPAPPPNFMPLWEQEMYRKRSEAEKAYQEQGYQPNPAAAEPMKAGLPASEFDKLPVWKQNTLRLMPILEYGMQGLGGAILGGVVGGIGGAIIGAPLMIGASYKAKQIQAAIDAGEKVTDAQKNFLNFFNLLNVPAEELEKMGGFEAQIIYSLIDPDKYGEVHELFGNWENFFAAAKINPEVLTGKSQVLDSILKTGYAIAMGSSYLLKGGAGNGEMFENVGNTLEAGSIFYESLLSGKNTVDGKNLQDIAIEQDKVHGYKYMQDQVKSGKVDKNKTIIGYDISSLNDIYTEVPDQKAAQGWMMQEFRKRLENGESPNDVFLSMSNKFGFFGSMKELAGNVLLDPLDVIPMLGNATMWQIGVKTGNKALMEAFGNVKTKTITGVDGKIKNVPVEVFGKVNDPFIMNLRSYKNLVRQMPPSQAAQLSAISKWIGGMTDDGFIKDFAQQPSKKNVLNYLRGLTPAARSNQVLSSFVDGLYNLVAGETDPRIIKGLLHSLANMKPEDAIKSAEGYKIKIMVGGEAVETNIPGWYLSAEAQLLPNAMKDAMKSVDEIFDTFDLSNPQRSIIRRVAEYMTKTPAELIAELKKMTNGEADQMYSKFLLKLDAISRKGDTNAKKLLDLLTKTDEANKLTGAKLKEMAKQFYGKNAVPFDESLLKMKALLILEESISKWAVDWFGVKPLHPLLRMSNVIKRAQSALLLGFNPSYFFNNALNNLVTMSWDGLLKMGKFYKEQELIADFGMTPARMAQGSGAMDFGEVGAGMLKMLGMEPEPIGNAIRKAGRGKNKEGKIDKIQKVDDFLKAGDKIQVFAYLSQVMEKWSSRKAVVRGIQEFMNYSHIEGKGYTKMPDQLFMDLERIEPGLGKKVKKVIEGNFSKEKIEKLIWGDMGVNPSIRDVLDPAAKDMLDQLGILKEIEKDLAKAKTKDDVSAAFTKVRKAAQKEMSNVVRRNAMKLVEDAKLKAGIEKTQGVLDMIDQITRLRTDFWLTHFEFMAKVAEDASQKKGASRWLTWENGKTEANTNWNTFATIEAAKYLGILDGLGLDKQSITYHNVVDNLLQQRNTWDGFFAKQQELFYKFQDEANAIENPKDRQALWYKMNEEINQHYLDAALKEDQLTLEMDQYFIDQYTKQFESKGQLATQEAKRWRDAINLERRRMIQAQMLYRTGMVPENMLAWGDLLSADIKKAIFDLTGFNPLHTFQRATRDKINPKFYQDIYTQFIRDMNQASNENAPGMPMPEPPITPEGSGTATTATTPPQGEGIPTMMTQKMRNDLSALGYLQEDIANMTPQQAWDVINNGQKKIITDATQPSMMKDPVGKTVKPRAVNEAETEIWAAIAEVKPELAGVDELGKINPEAKLNIIKWLNKHSSSARAKATLGDDGKRTLKWSDITPDDIRQAAATEKSIADASPSLFGDQTPPVTDVTPEQVTDVTPAAGETTPGTAAKAPEEEIIPIIDEYRARTNQIKAGETARQKYERLLEVRNQLETNLNEMINLLPAPRIGKEAAERVLYDVLGSKGRLDQYEAMRLIWEGFANSYAKANGGSPDDWYDQMIVTRGGSHGLNGKVIGQRMIDTKFFKNWFSWDFINKRPGTEFSKVVNKNGEPLIVYHGTNADFKYFDPEMRGKLDAGYYGKGYYLSENPGMASYYASQYGINNANVIPAYVALTNPLIVYNRNEFLNVAGTNSMAEATEKLISMGYDGVLVKEREMPGATVPHQFKEVVAFYPEQIKSIHNSGSFDPNDHAILYQRNPDSINFRSWFKDSKIVDEEGQALQVLHGTTRNFDAMDVSKTNQDNFVGRGLYFTDSMADVGNYSGIGADLNNRIEYQIFRLSESFNDDPYVYEDLLYAHFPDRADDILEGIDDLDFDDYRVLAEAQLMDHGGSVIPAYLRMEKPVYMGNPRGKRSSVIEYVFDLDDADNVIDEYFVTDHGDRVDLKGIIEDLGEQYYIQNVWDEFTQRADELFDGEISLTTIKKIFDEIFEGAVDEFSGELTHGGQIFNEFVQAAGYDGIMMNAELFFPRMEGTKGATHYIVFDPNQAKSVFNPDIFGVDDNRLLFQDAAESLIALHNIYDHELISALELGGFPVPSIAITRGDIEFEGTGFGDVTLIGNRRMIDPRRDSRNRVFSADVWSPDFPREYWYPVKMADARKVGKRFYENFGAIDQQHEFWAIEDATLQNPSKPRLFEVLMGREGSKYTFLKEQGIEIEVPTRNRDLGDYAVYINETVFNWFKENYHAQSGKYEPEFVRGFSQVFKENLYEAIQNKYAGTGVDIDDMYRIRLETMFDPETGNLHWRQYDNMRSRLSKMIDEPIETDFIELTKRIKEAMKGKEEAHRAWAQEIADSLFDEPYIEGKNKKKMRLTLSNVVEVMTAQKVKNQQKAFTYNMSQARARSAKEFYTIDQMKEKIGNLATREDVKNFVDADVSKKLEKVDNIMHRHYKWSDGFEMRNDIFRAMGQYLAGKSRSKNAMESALYRFDFSKDLTDEFINAAMDAAKAIEKMPVNYFEAKPQRAVYPNEFTGAVIPKNASKELIKKLQEWNMEYKVYDPDVPGDRLAKVKEYHDREGVLFQRKKRGATRWAEDGTAILHAFEAADISTFLHETVHVFTPQMSIEHSEIIRSWLRTEHKMDLPSGWHRDPIRYRDASEILARGMEKYFSEGIAPSAKLRQVFESFKKWIVEIYRRIEGSEIDVKLNDNVRKVFGEWVNGGYVDELIDTNLPIMPDPTELTKLQGLINEERLTLQTGKFNGRKVAKEYLDQMQKSYEKHLAQMEEFEVRLKAWNEYQKTKVIHLADPKQLAAQKIRDDFNTWKVQKFRDDFGAMVERNKNLDQATKEQHVHEFQMNVVRVAQEEGIAVPKDELEMYAAWKKKKDAEAAERSTSHVFATNEVSTSLDLRENLDADFNVLVERQGQQSFPKEGVTRDMMRRASKRHDAVQFAQKTRYGKVQSLTIAKHLDKFIDDGFVYGKVKQGAVMRHALVKGGDQVILDAAEAAYVQTIFNEGEFAKNWNDADFMPKPEVPETPATLPVIEPKVKQNSPISITVSLEGKEISVLDTRDGWAAIYVHPRTKAVLNSPPAFKGEPLKVIDWAKSMLKDEPIVFEMSPGYEMAILSYRGFVGNYHGGKGDVFITTDTKSGYESGLNTTLIKGAGKKEKSIEAWKKNIDDYLDGKPETKQQDIFSAPAQPEVPATKVGTNEITSVKDISKGQYDKLVTYRDGIKGKNDNKLVAYQHIRKQGERYSTREEGMVGAKVSDMENAKTCSSCNRKIVHVFYVQDANGVIKPYGSEHLHEALGYKSALTESKKDALISQLQVEQTRLDDRTKVIGNRIKPNKSDANWAYREANPGQGLSSSELWTNGSEYVRIDANRNMDKEILTEKGFTKYESKVEGLSDKAQSNLDWRIEKGNEHIGYKVKANGVEDIVLDVRPTPDGSDVEYIVWRDGEIVTHQTRIMPSEVLGKATPEEMKPGLEALQRASQPEPSGTRAKAGGEYGVNGEWYNGGEFLPSSPDTIKGSFRNVNAQKAKAYLERKQEVAPYTWETPPGIDQSPIRNRVDALAYFDKTGYSKETGWQGKLVLRDNAREILEKIVKSNSAYIKSTKRIDIDVELALVKDLVDRFNNGERWYTNDQLAHLQGSEQVVKDLVEPVPPIKETPAEINVWNKKPKARQEGFFDKSGEDLPLFSGTAQRGLEEIFAPQEVAPQASLFDMREQLPTIEGKQVEGGAEGTPLFGKQPIETSSQEPIIRTGEQNYGTESQAATGTGEPGRSGIDVQPGRIDRRSNRDASGKLVIARAERTEAGNTSLVPENLHEYVAPHQLDGVAKAIQALDNEDRLKRGFILADGTGAGKTRQQLAIAKTYADQGRPVIIITKAEVIKADWKKETFAGSFRKDADAMKIDIELSPYGEREVLPGKIYLSTYERMENFYRAGGIENAIIIFDEAHALKNAESKRAITGMSIADQAHGVIYASATPADKPQHIDYMFRAGIFEGKSKEQAYRDLGLTQRTIKVGKGRYQKEVEIWVVDSHVGSEEVYRRMGKLFDRMTEKGQMIKREISMDGIPVNFRKIPIPAEGKAILDKIEAAFANDYGEITGLKKALVLMHQRRQQEPMKIPIVKDLVKQELDAGRQVVVFLSRVNDSAVVKRTKVKGYMNEVVDVIEQIIHESEGTAKTLKTELEAMGIKDIAELHGGSKVAAPESMDQFQAGKSRVMIATLESGGTGINLDDVTGNAPRSLIFMTAPFSAVENIQGAGRVWRMTTKSQPKIYYLFGDTPTDNWNAAIIAEKMKMLGATVEGEVRKLDIPDDMDADLYLNKLEGDYDNIPKDPKDYKSPLEALAYSRSATLPKQEGSLYQDAVQKDRKTFALDAGQNRYEFEYKIVSLDDLITSHTDAFGENPKYPQELQPRLRGRAAGQEQVNKIAAELKPEGYVADFHTTDRGAPIIGNDLVVESGNGRTMALRKAKAAYPEKYAAYQEAVKIAAEEYGLSVEGINDPVLVRERITDVDRAKFAEDANVESSAGMSSIENARKDIKYISDELLSNFNVAEKQTVEQALRKIENQSLVRSFVDQLPESEKGRMMDAKGALSIDGAARIKNAMILKIYPDDAGMRLLTAFAESLDEGTTNIQKVLYNTLGEMAMLEGAVKTGKIPADLSIAEDVSKAVDVYTRLRQENTSVSDYLAQQSFFEKELDDFQGEMLRFIDKNRRSPNKLRELISQYIQEAMKQPPAGQESMFTPRTTKGEILDAVTKRIGQETDFGSKTAVEEVTTPTTPGEIVDNTPGTGEEPGTGEQPAEQPAARPEPEEEIEEIPQPAQGAPFGTADQVIEPPIDEMLYEGWMQHILPTLDRAEKQMLNMEMPSDKSIGSMLSKEDQTNLRKYLGQVYSDISNEKMGAINHAMARRDFSLLNYANRTGFDTIAGGVFPYQFWFTRSALNWFARIATDPKILADYMRLTNFAIDAEDREGYPQRLKGKIGIPMPFLPDWMGKTAYIDPFRQIYPFQQLAAPFKRMQDENNLVNKKAAGYVQQALEDGRITDAQAREALENKRGDVWEDAIMDAKAAEDLEFKNPLDFAFAVASPSLPASLIYQFSPWGDKDKIGQLPITRTIQATTSMLGIGGARGLNIEEPFRKAAGMNSIDRYEEYRVNRELSNMVAEGLIDSETAILAMIDQKGDVYEQAQVRVAKQMNPRTFLSSVGLDFFPEGESEMRNLSVEYGKALEAKYEDGDEDALNKFWDTYPEYEARIASNNSQEPDKILNTFLRSRIWQAYNQMNGYEKNQVREGFGDLFSTAFLNKETRNYNAISTETLAAWARSLGANMPEQYANMPEIPGSTIPDAENKMLDQFVQERDQRFPGISELQEQLYALDPDSQELFRKNNPMLNEYSDWRNRWIADHPQSAQYLTGDQSELYGLPTEIQAAVYGYRADVAEYFPGIYDIQSQYFAINSSNKKSAFLKTHPELPAYWDYRREYAAAYPQAAPYILSDESLAKYILGEDRSPQTSNIAVPQAQDLDPALLRLLASYFISGKELSSGARAELNRLWKSAGSPAGSMENWLHAYVIPNLKK